MSIERTLRVKKTMIDVYIGRNLHILDRDQEGTMTITNTINADYIQGLLEWVGEVPFDNIILYHTDGVITEWSIDKGFKPVQLDSNELYYPFVEKCMKRRKQYLFRRVK